MIELIALPIEAFVLFSQTWEQISGHIQSFSNIADKHGKTSDLIDEIKAQFDRHDKQRSDLQQSGKHTDAWVEESNAKRNKYEKQIKSLELSAKSLSESLLYPLKSKSGTFNVLRRAKTFLNAGSISEHLNNINGHLEELSDKLSKDIDTCEYFHLQHQTTKITADKYINYFDLQRANIRDGLVLNFDDESSDEGKLRKLLLRSTEERDLGLKSMIFGVWGAGGLGKSAVLCGLCADQKVQESFKNGIFHLTVGNDATEGSIIVQLQRIVESSGGHLCCQQIKESSNTLSDAVNQARKWFQQEKENLKILFIFDDIWQTDAPGTSDYLDSLLQLIDGSNNCRVVFSTRNRQIVHMVGTELWFSVTEVQIKARSWRTARHIFLKHAFINTSNLNSKGEEYVDMILKRCSGYPIALSICGSHIKCTQGDRTLNGALEDLNNRLLHGELTDMKHSSKKTIASIVKTSLADIQDWFTPENMRRYKIPSLKMVKSDGPSDFTIFSMFSRMAVLENQMYIDEGTIHAIWGGSLDRAGTQVILKNLVNRNLVQRSPSNTEKFGLHDLILENCMEKAKNDDNLGQFHRDMLIGFHDQFSIGHVNEEVFLHPAMDITRKEVDTQVRNWWKIDNGPNHYLLNNLIRHLVGGERLAEAVSIISDMRWTKLRISNGGRVSFLAECEIVQKHLADKIKHTNKSGVLADLETAREGIELIRNAADSYWSYLGKDVFALKSQVLGNLLGNSSWIIDRYLYSKTYVEPNIWLCPMQPYYEKPKRQDNLIRMHNWLHHIVVNWELKLAIVLEGKGGDLRPTWVDFNEKRELPTKLQNGVCVRSIACSSSWDTAAVVTKSNELVIFNAINGTLKYSRPVALGTDKVTLTSDGKNAITIGPQTVQIWDIETKTEKSVDNIPTGGGISLTGKGKRIVYATSNKFFVLEFSDSYTSVCQLDPDIGCSCSHILSMDVRGKYLLSVSIPKCQQGTNICIQLWDLITRKCLRCIEHSRIMIQKVVLGVTDSWWFVTRSNVGEIHFWDISNENVSIKKIGNHKHFHGDIAVQPDGKLCLTCSDGTFIKIWDVDSSIAQCQEKDDGLNEVKQVVISPATGKMFSVLDKTITEWNKTTGKEESSIHIQKDTFTTLVHTQQNDVTLMASILDIDDQTGPRLEYKISSDLKENMIQSAHFDLQYSVVSGQAERRIITWGQDKLKIMYPASMSSGSESEPFKFGYQSLESSNTVTFDQICGTKNQNLDEPLLVDVDESGNRIVAAKGPFLTIYGVDEQYNIKEEQKKHMGEMAKICCVALSGDGETVIFGCHQEETANEVSHGRVYIWRFSKNDEPKEVYQHLSHVRKVSISRKGVICASASNDCTIRILLLQKYRPCGIGSRVISNHEMQSSLTFPHRPCSIDITDFFPDDKGSFQASLIVGCTDGTVATFKINLEK